MPIPAAALPFLAQGAMQYGPGVARGIYRGNKYLYGGLANRLQGLGQQYLPQGVQDVLGGIGNSISGFGNALMGEDDQMTPEQQAQQSYLQQIQQPVQLNTAQRQQQMINQFEQQDLPALLERFTSMGGQRSGAFGQQLGSARANLRTNLGALGEENALQEANLNQNRLGELRGHLGQQQQMGLQSTIANREAQLRNLGMMQNYDLGQQQQNTNRLGAYGNVLQGLGNFGGRQPWDTINQAGQGPGLERVIRGLMQQR